MQLSSQFFDWSNKEIHLKSDLFASKGFFAESFFVSLCVGTNLFLLFHPKIYFLCQTDKKNRHKRFSTASCALINKSSAAAVVSIISHSINDHQTRIIRRDLQWFDIKKSKYLNISSIYRFSSFAFELFSKRLSRWRVLLFFSAAAKLSQMRGHTYWWTRSNSLRAEKIFTSKHNNCRVPNSINSTTCDAKAGITEK